jgi:type IV pilus assembly protein PilO
MKIQGSYHQIADFFFQVSELNRIVNIKDMSMNADKKERGQIQMSCSAVTYMFSEPKEEKASTKNKGKKKG